jgi:hypothetical protein
MPFTHLYDGGMAIAPTRQVCAISQNTEVSVIVTAGTPQYLPQGVHGSLPAGDNWLGFSRSLFGFSLWVDKNCSIRVILYMRSATERDFRGWRLYQGQANVLTGYELPPHQFKVMLYNDEDTISTIQGFVSLRSM